MRRFEAWAIQTWILSGLLGLVIVASCLPASSEPLRWNVRPATPQERHDWGIKQLTDLLVAQQEAGRDAR